MREKMSYERVCFIICTLATVIGLVLGRSDPCYAKEGEDGGVGISVSYVKMESDKFPLYVSIVGNGRLYDGEAVIKEQVNKYEIEYGTEKSFRIDPDAGHELQKVILDGTDITATAKDGSITVRGQDYEQHLTVYFEAVQGTGGGQNTAGKGNGFSGVRTGDPASLGISIAGLLSSVFILFLLRKKKYGQARA